MTPLYAAFQEGFIAMLEKGKDVNYIHIGRYIQMWLAQDDLLDLFTIEEHLSAMNLINIVHDQFKKDSGK